MEDQHLRQETRRMGQAREVDSQQQALLTQRPLADPDTAPL